MCIGATVLFYGAGDGTWPLGKPGFLFWLEIEQADGHVDRIVSDGEWQALLCRAWPPGRAKRWYLRALQEEFDARLYPYGWSGAGFQPDGQWLPAMPLTGSPNKPALSTNYYEYMLDLGGGPPDAELRPRSIPLLRESLVPAAKLAETLWLEWHSTPQDYFDFRMPDAFQARSREQVARRGWRRASGGSNSMARAEPRSPSNSQDQVVGWPGFHIEAPGGHDHRTARPRGPRARRAAACSTPISIRWTRFICRDGVNRFETFDFESLRWLQLHIHNAKGPVTVSDVHVRRRVFPWPNEPQRRRSASPRCSGSSMRPSTPSTTAPRKRSWTAWPASASNTAATAGTSCTRCTWRLGRRACPRAISPRSARA